MRGAAGGGGAGTTSSSNDDSDDDFDSEVEKNTGGRKVSVSLPSFEVGGDDDDEDEEVAAVPAQTSSSSSSSTTSTSTATTETESSKLGEDAALTRIDLPTTFDDKEELPEDSSTVVTADRLDTENQIV